MCLSPLGLMSVDKFLDTEVNIHLIILSVPWAFILSQWGKTLVHWTCNSWKSPENMTGWELKLRLHYEILWLLWSVLSIVQTYFNDA